MNKKRRPAHGVRSRHEQQYRWCLGALVMMVPVVLVSGWGLLPPAQAAAWEEAEMATTDGAGGRLWVSGTLTESACRLDMVSARQEVVLGDIGTGRLQHVGDRGAPVPVQLRLHDCLRVSGSRVDARTGGLTWSTAQPAVTVSFMAPADPDSPHLVQVQGARGIGLRILDTHQQDIRLGSRGTPLLMTPGESTLNYTVMPERTAAPLQAGAYRATVDFRLNYD
ncbi:MULTISPECIES: fimbrial protein [Serratia]|uniref:fimbrial protein n=1 Tax=Serratia TaxID=613 RepID=UPI001F4BD251|nr:MULTISPECIES: fimbrial protein [Serratia]ULG10890.1 fimbrial protein [Serratia entomophila]CAI1948730.1 S-fimbrial protein subunit SfaG precursor [Serratia quinivorans]CAI2158852.1 S-fimbrial protein subunit SfaG precursor [Serratia quinivorans]